MKKPIKILIVEDSEDDAKLALRALQRGGFDPTHRRVQSAAQLEAALAQERWDAVISDFNMPGFTGMDALGTVRGAGLDLPFILISGTIGEETAVAAMKAGASDYVMKASLARLAPALERELKDTQTRAANRQAQAALIDSEERFRQMAENIRDVFFLLDTDSDRMLYVSPAYEEIWGRSCESLYANQKSWAEAVHPDDRASSYENYRHGMAAGKAEFEFRMVRPDGSMRWIEVRGFPVADDAGRTVRIAGIAKDVTERKSADQKFKDLLESAPDAMLIVDSDSEIVLVNLQAVNLFGWRREELLGQKVEILMPERFRHSHQTMQSSFFGQPKIRSIDADRDLFGLRKDGAEFPVEISLSPLVTDQGTLVISTVRDITERKRAEEALRWSETQLQGALNATVDGILAVDSKGKIIQANRRFAELWRIPQSLLESRDDAALLAFILNQVSDSEAFLSKVRALYGSDTVDMDTVTFKDGRVFERYSAPMLIEGSVIGRVWSFRDITERKNSDARIVYLNRVYAVLSGINTLIVRAHDRDNLFTGACRIAVEAGGFRMAMVAIVDRSTMKVVPVASAGKDEELMVSIRSILASSEDSPKTMSARAIREKRVIVSNAAQNDPQVLFSTKYDESGVRSLAVFPLIVADEAVGVLALYASETGFFQEEELKLLTELAGDVAFAIDHIEKQERLNYLAYYDVLTALANRSLFLERVAQSMRSAASGGHKLALFLVDLERFKNINDSLGRPAGDALLRQVAEWLTAKTGDANLLARVGADLFAVLLPEVRQDGEVARALERSIGAFLEHPFRLNEVTFRIAAKVGIALFPDDGADADTLFKNAEAALKKAKASGERYLFYTQKMTEMVAGKLTLENHLRQALDKGEFVLHYQPKVNLVSGKLTSAEALIRWNDPRTGLVPPGRFIPILEETGMIYEVGRWALRRAIEDYLRWRNAGLAAVRIAVNVSPLQLRNRAFIDEIREVIGVDAHAAAGLELEITESLIMEDVKHSIASLQAIRAMGVTIAIDDFGTGFSSLSYLAKLPVDTLKIDRSFVIEMTEGPDKLALVSTIINLAHSLKLKVVAEGVETEEQSRLLRLLSCDEIQGYLFSKPVPGEIFETKYLVS